MNSRKSACAVPHLSGLMMLVRRPTPRRRRARPGRRGCQSRRPPVSRCGSFRAFDRDAEVLSLALDRVHLAVELADAHDAVEERGVAVVVEDQVATGRPVADVSGGGIVPFGRTL